MKRKLLTAIVILLIAAPSSAQNTRINLYGSGVFDDKVDSRYDANNYYNGTIKRRFSMGSWYRITAKIQPGNRITIPPSGYKSPY